MKSITIISELTSIVFPMFALIIAALGLNTWRNKLWGENKFTLSMSVVKELLLLKEEVLNFRSPFYPAQEMYEAYLNVKKDNPEEKYDNNKAAKYAENSRWNKIVEHYELFKTDMIKLQVIVNDYEINVVKNDDIEKILKEINSMRALKEMHDQRTNIIEFMDKEQRDEYFNQEKKMFKVLMYNGENDEMNNRINEYFNEINKRIRKYLK